MLAYRKVLDDIGASPVTALPLEVKVRHRPDDYLLEYPLPYARRLLTWPLLNFMNFKSTKLRSDIKSALHTLNGLLAVKGGRGWVQ